MYNSFDNISFIYLEKEFLNQYLNYYSFNKNDLNSYNYIFDKYFIKYIYIKFRKCFLKLINFLNYFK